MRQLILLWTITVSILLVTGCGASKKTVKNVQEKTADASSPKTAMKPDSLTGDELKQLRKIMDDLKDVPFDFDQYSLPTQSLEIIKENVAILNKMLEARKAVLHITLEGNCDDRGSQEYNLALGAKRAQIVRDYLVNVGFTPAALKTLSYGEERPKVQGHSEEAWAANRRVQLVVTVTGS
ncbi:MAG: OmpA family protein [Fibrobacterota bacterium]